MKIFGKDKSENPPEPAPNLSEILDRWTNQNSRNQLVLEWSGDLVGFTVNQTIEEMNQRGYEAISISQSYMRNDEVLFRKLEVAQVKAR